MRKILYIQIGVGFRFVNRNVIEQLKKHYPDHEIELYDLKKDPREEHNLADEAHKPLIDQLRAKLDQWYPDKTSSR